MAAPWPARTEATASAKSREASAGLVPSPWDNRRFLKEARLSAMLAPGVWRCDGTEMP